MGRLAIFRGLAVLAALGLAGADAAVDDGDDDPPPIKEVMEKLNKGPDALTAVIGRDLEKDAPDWDELTDLIEEYGTLVAALGENVPPRGEPASWERLTTRYREDCDSLARAVEQQDREAALEIHAQIRRACMACHVKHKP